MGILLFLMVVIALGMFYAVYLGLREMRRDRILKAKLQTSSSVPEPNPSHQLPE